jgi:hypothetical protein
MSRNALGIGGCESAGLVDCVSDFDPAPALSKHKRAGRNMDATGMIGAIGLDGGNNRKSCHNSQDQYNNHRLQHQTHL